MNKSKKNKIVIASILGVALLSVGSIGFATWITGISDTTKNSDITVTVDTSENKTIMLEATLSDNSISLMEPTISGQPILNVENGSATDLDITFSSFRVVLSGEYTLDRVALTLEIPSTDGIVDCTVNNNAIVPTNLYGTTQNTDNKSYISLGTSSLTSTNGLKLVQSGETGYIAGYTVYTLNSMTMSFSWGSIFDNQAPTAYYNGKASDGSMSVEAKLALKEQAHETLNHMHDSLSGKKLNLKIEAIPTNN